MRRHERLKDETLRALLAAADDQAAELTAVIKAAPKLTIAAVAERAERSRATANRYPVFVEYVRQLASDSPLVTRADLIRLRSEHNQHTRTLEHMIKVLAEQVRILALELEACRQRTGSARWIDGLEVDHTFDRSDALGGGPVGPQCGDTPLTRRPSMTADEYRS